VKRTPFYPRRQGAWGSETVLGAETMKKTFCVANSQPLGICVLLPGITCAGLTTAYSITSSAIASSIGGTSMPSVLAVCWLIANSNLVDCTTGKSAGLVPLRTSPV
jgi:hypothetical protein